MQGQAFWSGSQDDDAELWLKGSLVQRVGAGGTLDGSHNLAKKSLYKSDGYVQKWKLAIRKNLKIKGKKGNIIERGFKGKKVWGEKAVKFARSRPIRCRGTLA